MKIGIAQTRPLVGDIQHNLIDHLKMVESAVALEADALFFPELSITGYEPKLSDKLATKVSDSLFDPFQKLANDHSLTIGIGMPTVHSNGIRISMLLFQAFAERSAYSKQLLHKDELAYFISGNEQVLINSTEQNIAIGICYETLQEQHLINAQRSGADIYIASVAKSQTGVDKAYRHFPKMAKELNMPILMCNSVGHCDDFICAGNSAIWDSNGVLIGQLDQNNTGVLFYDTTANKTLSIT